MRVGADQGIRFRIVEGRYCGMTMQSTCVRGGLASEERTLKAVDERTEGLFFFFTIADV